MRVHDCDHIAGLIPAVQRLLPQHVKKLIHIKHTGWLHDNAVIAHHGHRDQFGLKTASVRFITVSPDDHLQLAMVAQKVLQKHHIHVNGAVIIFKDADILTLVDQIFCIAADPGRLACA